MILVMLLVVYMVFGGGGWRGPCGHGDDSPPRKDSESALDILKKTLREGRDLQGGVRPHQEKLPKRVKVKP